MIWQLDVGLVILLILTAIAALEVRDLLAAAMLLSAYSFTLALLLAEMGAIDVSFTEASLGSAVTGTLFIAALTGMKRRSED